jgi:hypothetical protein
VLVAVASAAVYTLLHTEAGQQLLQPKKREKAQRMSSFKWHLAQATAAFFLGDRNRLTACFWITAFLATSATQRVIRCTCAPPSATTNRTPLLVPLVFTSRLVQPLGAKSGAK